MKVEKKKEKQKEFEPVEITLTLESLGEVATLWCYLNPPLSSVVESDGMEGRIAEIAEGGFSTYRLWDELNDIIINHRPDIEVED